LSAAALTVELRPPHVRRGEYANDAVPVRMVRVWEAHPPAGTTPLEWLLLTNLPVSTPEDIRRVARYYSCRMQIEEYHKVQKTGLSIEGCQFQSAKKMQAFVAVMSVVSVMLLNLRLAARDPERSGRPAEQYLPRLWVVVLEQLKVRQRPLETVRDFWLHLAWLGGYMRDKPDRDPPGWQTLWRGWLRFQIILQYELSRAKM
jgi:hypothetical protein